MKQISKICIVMFVIITSFLIWKFLSYGSFAKSDDIYDVVLFWGQSNMSGWDGLYSSEHTIDSRLTDLGINNFSQATGINVSILEKYDKMNHVSVDIPNGTVYEYLYGSNSLKEINANTSTLGENLRANVNGNSVTLENITRQSWSDYLALEESYGTNMVPQFAKKYYEETGHKVIAVMASNGGEEIAHFLPHDQVSTYSKCKYYCDEGNKEQYIYEALVLKYNAAVKYLEDHSMTIGNKIYAVFQGENDAVNINYGVMTGDDYYDRYMTVHNNLKNDLGIQLGLIVETAYSLESPYYTGVLQIHDAQENLIKNNSDIILGSDYAYRNYVPSIEHYTGSVEYNIALSNSKLSRCYTLNDNSIHFTAAALSQIGFESAENAAQHLSENDVVTFDNSLVVDKNLHIIAGIRDGLTYSQLRSMINTVGNITFKGSNNQNVNDSDIIATGASVEILINGNTLTYYLSVLGDLNGDGLVEINDVSISYRACKKIMELTNLQLLASDFNGDNKIGISEVSKLYRYRMKIISVLA